MSIRLAGALLRRRPALRRFIWRRAYQYLSAHYADQPWTFTNYGFAFRDGDPGRPQVRPEDELERFGVQLYHRVASGKLGGLDVLEISCGRGGGASYIARCLQPHLTVGLDAAPGMIAYCRLHHRLPRLSFCVGDAEVLPFGAEAFDAVVNVEAAHCYGSLPQFLSETSRVLRPNGWLLFADMLSRGDIPAVRAQITTSGFTTLEEEDMTSGVVRALDEDTNRRQQIAARAPRPFRGAFAAFAGVQNTAVYRMLRSGDTAYLRFAARRNLK